MQRFVNKTVIVTGAASGIGRGVAERFSQEGANVVLCDIDEGKLQDVAGQLPADRTLGQRCNVAHFADVEALVAATVKRFGGLDVMVNNAGIAPEATCRKCRWKTGARRWTPTSPASSTAAARRCRHC